MIWKLARLVTQNSQGQLDLRTLDRLMARRCVGLAAAVAEAAGQVAANAYTWVLAKANARRWDSEVILFPAGYLTDYCRLFLVRERPLSTAWRQQSPSLLTLDLLLRQLANSLLLWATFIADFEKSPSGYFLSSRHNFSIMANLVRCRQWSTKCCRTSFQGAGTAVCNSFHLTLFVFSHRDFKRGHLRIVNSHRLDSGCISFCWRRSHSDINEKLTTEPAIFLDLQGVLDSIQGVESQPIIFFAHFPDDSLHLVRPNNFSNRRTVPLFCTGDCSNAVTADVLLHYSC